MAIGCGDVVWRASTVGGRSISGIVQVIGRSPSEAMVWSDGLLASRRTRSRLGGLRAAFLGFQMMESGD